MSKFFLVNIQHLAHDESNHGNDELLFFLKDAQFRDVVLSVQSATNEEYWPRFMCESHPKLGEIVSRNGCSINDCGNDWSLFNYYQEKRVSPVLIKCPNSCVMKNLVREIKREVAVKFYQYQGITQEIIFLCMNRLRSCGWVEVDLSLLKSSKNGRYVLPESELSKRLKFLDIIEKSRVTVLCFDLEVTSSNLKKFPNPHEKEDRIVQIGMVIESGSLKKKFLINLGNCASGHKGKDYELITFAHFPSLSYFFEEEEYKAIQFDFNELLMIHKFFQIAKMHQVDIITGFNTFGFDENFLYQRYALLVDKLSQRKYKSLVEELLKKCELDEDQRTMFASDCQSDKRKAQCIQQFSKLGLEVRQKDVLVKQRLSSSGLGNNDMTYIRTPGITHIDVLQAVRSQYSLDSYTLDNVSKHLVFSSIAFVKEDEHEVVIGIKKPNEFIREGRFVVLSYNVDLEEDESIKLEVKRVIDSKTFVIEKSDNEFSYAMSQKLCVVKDDVEIWKMFGLWQVENYATTDPSVVEQRRVVADYCVQDCDLVLAIINKTLLIDNGLEIAKICGVPFSMVYMRGQGIRIFSLIFRYAYDQQVLIEDSTHRQKEEYDGAFVFAPTPQYIQQPIPVLDFESLYPNCIRDMNMSNETCVRQEYVSQHTWKELYPKLNQVTIEEKNKTYYFIKEEYQRGIIPRVLTNLLDERKRVKRLMSQAADEMTQVVYNVQQLALKVIANSIYGQTGAETSKIRMIDIAESTTAYGRQNIKKGIEFVNNQLKPIMDQEKDEAISQIREKFGYNPHIVYGDSDSIFINLDLCPKNPEAKHTRREVVAHGITLGKYIEKQIKQIYTKYLNLRYEKCLTNFIIFTKKRYLGWLYEDNPEKRSLYATGIVLKRRDNSKIVKHVYKRILKNIIYREDIQFQKNTIDAGIKESFLSDISDILSGNTPRQFFVTTRKLNDNYKNEKAIVHKVLANRVKEETGQEIQVNERIEFIYTLNIMKNFQKTSLQGEKVELAKDVYEKNIPIDFLHYINNQIKTPCLQLFETCMDPDNFRDLCEKFDLIIQQEQERRNKLYNEMISEKIFELLALVKEAFWASEQNAEENFSEIKLRIGFLVKLCKPKETGCSQKEFYKLFKIPNPYAKFNGYLEILDNFVNSDQVSSEEFPAKLDELINKFVVLTNPPNNCPEEFKTFAQQSKQMDRSQKIQKQKELIESILEEIDSIQKKKQFKKMQYDLIVLKQDLLACRDKKTYLKHYEVNMDVVEDVLNKSILARIKTGLQEMNKVLVKKLNAASKNTFQQAAHKVLEEKETTMELVEGLRVILEVIANNPLALSAKQNNYRILQKQLLQIKSPLELKSIVQSSLYELLVDCIKMGKSEGEMWKRVGDFFGVSGTTLQIKKKVRDSIAQGHALCKEKQLK